MSDTSSTTPNNTPDAATGLTPDDLRRAALNVCRYSESVDDARELLESLGLVEDLRSHAVAS